MGIRVTYNKAALQVSRVHPHKPGFVQTLNFLFISHPVFHFVFSTGSLYNLSNFSEAVFLIGCCAELMNINENSSPARIQYEDKKM